MGSEKFQKRERKGMVGEVGNMTLVIRQRTVTCN